MKGHHFLNVSEFTTADDPFVDPFVSELRRTTPLITQHLLHPGSSVSVLRLPDVGVGVSSEANLTVAENILHDLKVYTLSYLELSGAKRETSLAAMKDETP